MLKLRRHRSFQNALPLKAEKFIVAGNGWISRPHKIEDDHDMNSSGALASNAVINKRVRSTQTVNHVTRKNDDPSREITVNSGASENVIYDIAIF